jgi:hypothetical protein
LMFWPNTASLSGTAAGVRDTDTELCQQPGKIGACFIGVLIESIRQKTALLLRLPALHLNPQPCHRMALGWPQSVAGTGRWYCRIASRFYTSRTSRDRTRCGFADTMTVEHPFLHQTNALRHTAAIGTTAAARAAAALCPSTEPRPQSTTVAAHVHPHTHATL